MLALTLPVLALPPLSAALVGRGVPPRAVLVAAVVLIVAGNLGLSLAGPKSGTVLVAVTLLAIGTANGIVTGLVDPQVLIQVSPNRLGMASGLLSTVRSGGNTITIAVVAAILVTLLHGYVGDHELAVQIATGTVNDAASIANLAHAFQITMLIVAAACGLAGAVAIVLTNPAVADRAQTRKRVTHD